MESETLSHIHVVARVDDTGKDFYSFPATFYSFLFAIESPENIESTFQFLFSKENKYPFTVTLQLNPHTSFTKNMAWFNKLCIILCHPQYLKYNNQLIIGILPVAGYNPGDNHFMQHLDMKVKEQGFNDVVFVNVASEQRPDQGGSRYAVYNEQMSSDDFYDWYIKNLCDNDSLMNIFIISKGESFIREALALKQHSEKRLENEQPFLYRLIRRIQSRTEEIYQYQQLVIAVTEDLSSKKAYLDFLLGKIKEAGNDEAVDFSEIMKVKRFYYQEYEVLPLWYKRFGHIIKALTGKRSFKSLFGDKLKNKQ